MKRFGKLQLRYVFPSRNPNLNHYPTVLTTSPLHVKSGPVSVSETAQKETVKTERLAAKLEGV